MNTSRKIGIIAISAALAVSATTALGAAGARNNDKTHEHMGGMMGGGGMMGMMSGKGGMKGMMDSCPMMRRNDSTDGDTGRPNSQWRHEPSPRMKKDG